MPIRPENKHLYPKNWREISRAAIQRAGNRCVGSPRYWHCRAKNYEPHPITGSKVILTVGHFDHDPTNNHPRNLWPWCQRCHTTYDAKHKAENRRKRLEADRQADIQRRIDMLSQGKAVVVNTRKGRDVEIIAWAIERGMLVSVDRKTCWGNPFKVNGTSKAEQERVVSLYREWIQTQPDLLRRIGELRGRALGCWCHPKPCHGDVLAKLANATEA